MNRQSVRLIHHSHVNCKEANAIRTSPNRVIQIHGLEKSRILLGDASRKTTSKEEGQQPHQQNGSIRFSNRTPLLKEIEARIAIRGPMTVAEFMNLALCHPQHGYYSTRGYNAFGSEGDFVTSPEISQLFGEMIGVWAYLSWTNLNKPKSITLIEFGGGRGTLMNDALRTIASFPEFYASIKNTWMIENSAKMRQAQQNTILPALSKITHPHQIKFDWVDSFDKIPIANDPVLIISQELFDALPVHQFEKTSQQTWSEKLVDVENHKEGESVPPLVDLQGLCHHLKFVLSPGTSIASKVLLGSNFSPQAPIGSRVEINAAGCSLVQQIAARLENVRGSALIVDYSENHVGTGDSLRGILKHKFVHPLMEPGNVDLSCDVDFESLTNAAYAISKTGLKISPILSQKDFLNQLGIQHRVFSLLQTLKHDEAAQVKLFSGYKRLVEDMGTCYKVMEISGHGENVLKKM